MTDQMRWDGGESYPNGAHEVVAWIHRNGGEARYEDWSKEQGFAAATNGTRVIAVRTKYGWDYAAPGDSIVMVENWFDVDAHAMDYTLREFIVEKAEKR